MKPSPGHRCNAVLEKVGATEREEAGRKHRGSWETRGNGMEWRSESMEPKVETMKIKEDPTRASAECEDAFRKLIRWPATWKAC